MLIYSKLSSNLEQEPHPQPPHRLRGGGLVVCQIYFDGFLVVRASCPRERDAHTTVHHFYLDKLLGCTLCDWKSL